MVSSHFYPFVLFLVHAMTSSVNLWGCDNLVQYVWFYMKLYYAKPYMYVVVLVTEKFFIVPCVIFTYIYENSGVFITCKVPRF